PGAADHLAARRLSAAHGCLRARSARLAQSAAPYWTGIASPTPASSRDGRGAASRLGSARRRRPAWTQSATHPLEPDMAQPRVPPPTHDTTPPRRWDAAILGPV